MNQNSKCDKMELNKNIKILGKHKHSTASEKYIDVVFEYPDGLWEGSVPIEYRRTGTYARNEEEEINILNKTYDLLNPENYNKWLENEETFWSENKKSYKVFL